VLYALSCVLSFSVYMVNVQLFKLDEDGTRGWPRAPALRARM